MINMEKITALMPDNTTIVVDVPINKAMIEPIIRAIKETIKYPPQWFRSFLVAIT